MDSAITDKVNDLVSQGRPAEEIRNELLAEGNSPESISQALRELNLSDTNETQVSAAVPMEHHEKIIQPEPGFDPTAK
jgi:hypothetical protein